jgi:hypothetical protein
MVEEGGAGGKAEEKQNMLIGLGRRQRLCRQRREERRREGEYNEKEAGRVAPLAEAAASGDIYGAVPSPEAIASVASVATMLNFRSDASVRGRHALSGSQVTGRMRVKLRNT